MNPYEGRETRSGREAPRARWQAAHTALLAGAAVAVTLVAAGPSPRDAWVVSALTLSTASLVGAFHASRRRILLWSTGLGILIGILSSRDLIRYDVEGRFHAVAATVVVCIASGLIIGGFVQFVAFLHHAVHGGREKKGE